VQLSGKPQNLLNTEFPASSAPLRIVPQRIAAIDTLVFQHQSVVGEVGAVRLHYADGSERVLSIRDGRDTFSYLDIAAMDNPLKPRIGWLGNYATGMHDYGLADSGEAAAIPSAVVHLENPEPNRAVAAISLEAPPAASPGLLFLALTLEPADSQPLAR
jgi:hypothetical protein